jgi:small subunit ribosomal protein S6
MTLYECTFIARQDISAPDVHKLSDKMLEILKNFGAELVKKEYWGLRPLAYAVKKNKKGHYIMLGIKANSEAIKEFERNCKINEDVIKYLTVKVDKIDDDASPMMQAPAKATPGAGAIDEMLM